MHHLALHTQRNRNVVEKRRGPCARAQRESPRVVFPFRRHDANSASGHTPLLHWLFDVHVRTDSCGKLEVGLDASLGIENASSRLVKGAHLAGHHEAGKASVNFRG